MTATNSSCILIWKPMQRKSAYAEIADEKEIFL